MRKLYAAIFAILMIFSTYAYAEGQTVVDEADYLTAAEELALEERLNDIKGEYQIDVAVVIVNSIGAKTAEAYADDYYDYNGYGLGVNDDGMLLLISKNPREYHITTHEKAVLMFSDSAIRTLQDVLVSYLSQDNYFDACMSFADTVDDIAYSYDNGIVYSDSSVGKINLIPLIGHVFLVSVIVAGVMTYNAYKGMNTARNQTNADAYVKQGSFNLTRSNDVFLFSNTTKTKIESSSSSSRGGRTHRSSSGRSHGGGGGRY